jgi:hypothetical protein
MDLSNQQANNLEKEVITFSNGLPCCRNEVTLLIELSYLLKRKEEGMTLIRVYCDCGKSFDCYIDFAATVPVAICPHCKKHYVGHDEIKHQMLKPVVLFTDDEPTCKDDT